MSRLGNLEETLIEKLNEWASSPFSAEIVVDTFLATMDAEEWDSNDKIKVLEEAEDYFERGGGRCLFICEVITNKLMEF